MKKMLIVVMMLFTSSVFAEGYAGIYGSNITKSKSDIGNETNIDHNQAVMMFGVRTSGAIGVSGDIFFNSNGAGASAGLFAGSRNLKIIGGVMFMDDVSYGKAGTYGNLESRDDVKANYVGVEYKMFTIRYIRYDADHTYTKRGIVGYTNGNPPKAIKGVLASSNDSVKREMIMAGVTFKF